MNAFEKFNQTVGFTPNERRVILFLVSAFVIGGVIKIYNTTTQTHQQFHYASADSEFAAKSAQIGRTDNASKSYTEEAPKVKETPAKNIIGTKLNLNTATKEELMKLPGVGEATAEQILIYRDEHGTMKTIDELMDVKGIGKKKFERMKPFITVGK